MVVDALLHHEPSNLLVACEVKSGATSIAGPEHVHETHDADLYAAEARGGRFWVDQVDDRFWSFHITDLSVRDAQSFLKAGVDSRRDLDWMWLPSAHLSNLWPGASIKGVQMSFRGSGLVGAETRWTCTWSSCARSFTGIGEW